jgi:acyl carrier protein
MARMDEDAIYAKLEAIFRREFDDPAIKLVPTTTAADIPDWDSHKMIEIILACEEVFSVRLKPREINGMENVAEMVSHLYRAVNK